MRSAGRHQRDISGHMTAGAGCGVRGGGEGRGSEGGEVETRNGDAGDRSEKWKQREALRRRHMSQSRGC